MTEYVTGSPVQIRAGAVSFHFKLVNEEWFGIQLDYPAKTVQADLVRDAFNGRSEITFEASGNMVPANAAICGASEVPEAINLNRGFTPPPPVAEA